MNLQLNSHCKIGPESETKCADKLSGLATDLWETKKPGFVRILDDEANWDISKKWAQTIKAKYKQLVVLGIGGSSMGARALQNYRYNQTVYFLDNIDASEIKNVWSQIKNSFDSTGFLIISKSGESLEIAMLMETLANEATGIGKDLFKNSFIISEDKPSILSTLANDKKIPLIPMPLDVGGRFSVLTPVGLVVAGFMGFDLDAIREGARQVLQQKEKLLVIAGELTEAIDTQTDLFVFWSYSSQLRWFNQWLCQLWAESLGKTKTLSGRKSPKIPWIVAATGASDQHSIYQHILESEQKKYVLITQSLEAFPQLGFTKPNLSFFKDKSFTVTEVMSAERDATAKALKEYGIPVTEMLFDNFDDRTIGYLFFWFESLTAILGNYYDINPYDQPAVQLGKRLALENLKLN